MKSLKLNKINKNQLSAEQMKTVCGGDGDVQVCGCGCCYADQGGSSLQANGMANAINGFHSPGCFNTVFVVAPAEVAP